ncbi:Wzz/FepE/Etk N-terminal domain-containing protein [Nesterenkonia sp. LB17]|uniref:polysaccharide biosynthesis tyrosine autokinase n=1 Tax=unclassified Nesterenkonia TaxID=2629769 RepID=UPI001F4C73B3|nr:MULTISPECIES: polysaccharide biosynthesis tyrosine autokinase [unclassified Nesterenkonia]MCH8562423.1 Wzz/FepE/Etk N-terminal domain-containing protein [Nesterenkonia sp. YGD6]MCH8565359.1 Wzz/FepE/Etk N-terminal domain-containing protein [Nesterenkonia sp. LB17]
MALHNFVRICRRRWASILLTPVIAVLFAAAIYVLQPVTYESTTKIYVSAATGESLEELQRGSTVVGQRVKSYADLVTTPAVLDPVVEDLRLPMSSSQLAESIDAEVPRGTSLLEITATADEAQAAADIANSTVTSLQTLVNEIEGPGEDPGSDGAVLVELSVVQDAVASAHPQGPRLELVLGTGLAVGILLGLGLAFLREARDTSVRTPRDLKDLTAAPLLGVTRGAPTVTTQGDRTDPRSVEAVASFREMRMRLMFGKYLDSPSSYVITSSVEGEGRTTVAVNLARSLVEGGRRTLLIGADFANPDIVHWFRTSTSGGGQLTDLTPAGLNEVLSGSAYFEDVIITDAEPGLDILPAGRGADHGLEACALDAMATLLEGCAETYDVTIIDTPALLSQSAAALLAQITTGVIVVARYGEVSRAQLSAGLELLTRARARLVGVVFTGVPPRGPDSLQDRRPPGSRRRRRGGGRGRDGDPGDSGQGLSARASGLSSARRRRLPDGTLALSEAAPGSAHIFTLPQDRT